MPSKSTNSPKASFGFDAKNKNAQTLAERFSSERIRQLNKETKIAVQLIIKQAIHEGTSPREAAKLIREIVGLNRPQALALKRYVRDLSPSLSPSAKQKAGIRYKQKMIRRRAVTIARTEVIDSLTAGMELSWGQAQQQGLLGANAQKEWMTTPVGACRICQALDGQTVPLNKTFISNTVGGLQRPTAHPNCRCGIAPVPGIGGGVVPTSVKPPRGDMLKTVTVKKKGRDPETFLRPRWDSSQFPPARRAGAESASETLDRFATKFDVDGNPVYTVERQRLHDEIVEKMLKDATPVDDPQLTVLGGGPASGKTAAKKAAMKSYKNNAVAVDPDEIRAMLPEYEEGLDQFARNAAAVTHEEASALAKRVIKEGQERQLNMIMDGTGDGGYGKFKTKVAKYRKQGASKITANYVTVDEDEAYKRMVARARKTERDPETGKIGKGGRWVPEQVLRGTHRSVSEVVPKALKDDLFDNFKLWDNNTHGKPPEVIAYLDKSTNGKLKVVDREKWNKFIAKGKETWDESLEYVPPWPKRGPTSKVAEQVEDHYEKYLQGLGNKKENALNEYTSLHDTASGYKVLNTALRKNPNRLNRYARVIQDIVEDAPQPPPPQLVYRGLRGKFNINRKKGDIFELDGFQSTSIDPEVAERIALRSTEWETAIMEIIPNRGAYIKSVSQYPEEMEFLLPHKAKYKIVGRKKVKISGKDVEIVQVRMLDTPPSKVAQDLLDANPDQLIEVETWKRHTIGFHKDDVTKFQEYNKPIFSAERLKLHDEILERTLKGVTPVKDPEMVVLGGGPASGKTAAKNAAKKRYKNNVAAVDPDEIRTMLPEYDELLGLTIDDQEELLLLKKNLFKKRRGSGESVTDEFRASVDKAVAKRKNEMIQENVEAGIANPAAASITHEESSALAKRILEEGQRRKLNMIADGTGDNTYESIAGKVATYRKRGATKVIGNYVSIPSDEAYKRMVGRAKRTGRFVPEKVLRGTHASVSRVAPTAIKNDLFDTFTLWDNSVEGADAEVVASWVKGENLKIKNRKFWKSFLAKGAEGLDKQGKRDFWNLLKEVDRLEIPKEAWPLTVDEIRYMGSREYQQEVRTRYRGYAEALPEETRVDINGYSGWEFFEINKNLREFPDQKLTGRDARIQRALNAKDAPKPPPPELVWRGVKDLTWGDFKTGDEIALDGFQSTSLNPKMASKWPSDKSADVALFEIKPARGIFIGDIAQDIEEMEFLLPHKAKYKVIGRKKVKIGEEGELITKWDVKPTEEELLALQVPVHKHTPAQKVLYDQYYERATTMTPRKIFGEYEVIQLEMLP